MAGTYLGYPFDEEVFSYRWKNEPDPVTTALIDSGVMVADAEIASQIAGGSNLYSVPFYKTIGGTPVNYDGKTDITSSETEGASMVGTVFGRAWGFTARDFVFDFNSGADPMSQIVSQSARVVHKYHQGQLVTFLDGLFGMTVTEDAAWEGKWADHTLDIASASATVSDDNKLGAATVDEAAVKACGDLAQGAFALAVMHSTVALNLAKLDLLEFRKYTDPTGIERQLPIADINGKTVLVTDRLKPDTTGDAAKYTTYVLGAGSIRFAEAPVKVPVEVHRDPAKNGGQDTLYIRERRAMAANGMTFIPQDGDGVSLEDADLFASTRYKPVFDPKCLAFAKIVSNG